MESQPFALRNKYWMMRHGRSVPNERSFIVSNLTHGKLPEYGLAPEGVQQAKAAGESFLMEMEDLRERFFGPTFELLSHEKYSEIWALDEAVLFMEHEAGESVADVSARLAKALATMEAEFHGYCSIFIKQKNSIERFGPLMKWFYSWNTKVVIGESVADVSARLANALATMDAEFHG